MPVILRGFASKWHFLFMTQLPDMLGTIYDRCELLDTTTAFSFRNNICVKKFTKGNEIPTTSKATLFHVASFFSCNFLRANINYEKKASEGRCKNKKIFYRLAH